MTGNRPDDLDNKIQDLVRQYGAEAVRGSLKAATRKRPGPKGKSKWNEMRAIGVWAIVERERLQQKNNISEACRQIAERGGVIMAKAPGGLGNLVVMNDFPPETRPEGTVIRGFEALRKWHKEGQAILEENDELLAFAKQLLGI